VLLPDHFHCLWTLPPEDADFSKRWTIIKRTVSKCRVTISQNEDGAPAVGRFWNTQIFIRQEGQ
jgi:REP element-mobilizing transposase RayT